jgi:hypothetical protein
MRRILFEQTDFASLPNPPAGFNYIGFDGEEFSEKTHGGSINPAGGGSIVHTLTYNDFLILLSSDPGIVNGDKYFITGFDTELYGGNDVLVIGLPGNNFTKEAICRFHNPRYDAYPVWDPQDTYLVDDIVIYGGKVWKNLTGSTGNPSSDPLETGVLFLDNTNWEFQEYDAGTLIGYYVYSWDKIEIGYADDEYYHTGTNLQFCINSRYDSIRNNYVRVGQLDDPGYGGDRWFFCGMNPISVFPWGNNNVNDCTITDSYFNCINLLGITTIYGVEMSNYSHVFNTEFRDTTIEGLTLKNESSLDGTFINCNIKNILLNNSSSIYGTYYSTDIINLNFSNESSGSGVFYNSYLNYINLDNYSAFTGINATASYFRNIDMTNESYIDNIELSVGGVGNSYFERINLSNRSYIKHVDLYNSSMYDIKLDNYSYIEGYPVIDIWNSSINYINFNNHSRIYGNIGLSSSYFKRIDMTNRSIIEGDIDFENSHLEKIDATNDSLINNLYFSNDSDTPGTSIENLNMNFSSITDIYLNNSIILAPSLDRSELINLHGDGLSLMAIDLNIGSFDFLSLGTVSNLTNGPSAKPFEYKYITQTYMNGSNGYGLTDALLDINTMLVPEGSYVDKLSINCTELVYSGDSATFSFGILGLTTSLEIAVSEISNTVKLFDISDGLDLSRSISDGLLSTSLSGGTDVTSGSIYMEITLKLNPFS